MNWIIEGKQDITVSITTDKSGYLIIIGLVSWGWSRDFSNLHSPPLFLQGLQVCRNVDVNCIITYFVIVHIMKQISELFCWKYMDWYFSDASTIIKLFMQNIYKFHPFSNSFFSNGGHAELEPILAAFSRKCGVKASCSCSSSQDQNRKTHNHLRSHTNNSPQIHVFWLWEETGVPGEKPCGDKVEHAISTKKTRGMKPTTFLLWGKHANHCTIVPLYLKTQCLETNSKLASGMKLYLFGKASFSKDSISE